MIERIQLQVNSRCNLKCIHCFYAETDKELLELSLEKAKQYIDILIAEGIKNIGITFKEPLLNQQLFEIIDYCTLCGVRVVLLTNGILLDRYCDSIINSGIVNLGISLDGLTPETNDQIRGLGSFEQVMKGVKKINLYKMTKRYLPVTLYLTVNKINEKEFQYFVKFIENIKVDKIVISEIDISVGEARNNIFLKKTVNDYYEVICQQYSKLKSPEFMLEFSAITPHQVFYYNFIYNINLPLMLPNCNVLANSYYLNSDGEIKLCLYYASKNMSKTKLHKYNIKDEKNEFYRERSDFINSYKALKTVKQATRCKNCTLFEKCNPCLLSDEIESDFFVFQKKCDEFSRKISQLVHELIETPFEYCFELKKHSYLKVNSKEIKLLNLVPCGIPSLNSEFHNKWGRYKNIFDKLIRTNTVYIEDLVNTDVCIHTFIKDMIETNSFYLKKMES